MLRKSAFSASRTLVAVRQSQLARSQLAPFSVARPRLSKSDGNSGPQDPDEKDDDAGKPKRQKAAARKTKEAKEAASTLAGEQTFKQDATEGDAEDAEGGSEGKESKQSSSEYASEAFLNKNERLLAVELPYRPAFPGMAFHVYSEDPKLLKAIATLARLREVGSWDGRLVAVLTRGKSEQSHLVTSLDGIHETGTLCQLKSFRIVQDPSSSAGRRSMHAIFFPILRVRMGELVETVQGGSSIAVRPMPVPRGVDSKAEPKADSNAEPKVGSKVEPMVESKSDSKPDQSTSDAMLEGLGVQWMKGLTAVPNEPFAINDPEIRRLCDTLVDLLDSYSTLNSDLKVEIERFSQLVPRAPGANFSKPGFLADFAASLLTPNSNLQRILETTNIKDRLAAVVDEMRVEISMQKASSFLKGHEVHKMRNREMMLREYLRIIQKQLDEISPSKKKETPHSKFVERALKLDMPTEVQKVYDEEMERFEPMDSSSHEFSSLRTYLDWLTSVPWGLYTKDRFVMSEAQQILDEKHYGMQDVKSRVLEFLAVARLSGSVQGKIVCLAGPPGVGKTSIGRAIAESLGRKFERVSVGGCHDVTELKGHRRTYVAALPGRIIAALKKAGSMNPVIMIDEIDKVAGRNHGGDPAAALLEILDPEQNSTFTDIYMEVPVDLSQVLFVCTANTLENISPPLRDRMEIIKIPGYLPTEKIEIARSFLAPKARKKSGLENAPIDFADDALKMLVSRYTREPGVRYLNQVIEKLFRKLAYKFISSENELFSKLYSKEALVIEAAAKPTETESTTDEATAVDPAEPQLLKIQNEIPEEVSAKVGQYEQHIEASTLPSIIGTPEYSEDRIFDTFLPGISMGLAYTSDGAGSTLFVETVLQEPVSLKSKHKLLKTGQLGDVMGESATIAHTFARMFMAKKFPRNQFLEHASLHTHFPEGAIKKDGPSAGIAMVTSLVSLAMNIPAHHNTAMTGEVTLTGRVLAIGGLREKTLAARNAGATRIIFPEANIPQWNELPENLREGMDYRPVKTYEDVFNIVFGEVDAAEVNAAWPALAEPTESVAATGAQPI